MGKGNEIQNRKKCRRYSLLAALLVWGLLVGVEGTTAAGEMAREMSLKKIAAARGLPYPPPRGKILIDKAARTLTLYTGDGTPLKEYPIALGANPVGNKLYEWDQRTPEGTYRVVEKIEKKRGLFRFSIQIDYPSPADRKRYQKALASGNIPKDRKGKYRDIGSDIMIYGGVEKDWTNGSIALQDADIVELFEATSLGIPVVILPQGSRRAREQGGRGAPPLLRPLPPGSGIEESLSGLLSPNGWIDINKHNNALIVTDLPENIDRIEVILKKLDLPAHQILIEARIVEANRDFQKRLGVLWSAAFSTQGPGGKTTVPIQGGRSRDDDPRGVGEHTIDLSTPLGTIGVDPLRGITLGRISSRMALEVELNAMEAAGQGRILSTPRITTLDNQEAVIESGLSIPYQKREELGTITIEFADALISLVVIPHVTPDNHILLRILATKDEADFIRQVQGVPTILTRHAATNVLVKDGETTVIGGLTKRDTSYNAAHVPWLGKLPLVGWLFRDQQQIESNEELLIFITPKIVGTVEASGA